MLHNVFCYKIHGLTTSYNLHEIYFVFKHLKFQQDFVDFTLLCCCCYYYVDNFKISEILHGDISLIYNRFIDYKLCRNIFKDFKV